MQVFVWIHELEVICGGDKGDFYCFINVKVMVGCGWINEVVVEIRYSWDWIDKVHKEV